MYDSVTIWVHNVSNSDVLDVLQDVKTTTIWQTGEVQLRGRLGNLTVSVRGGGISVYGSLPRFVHGSNFPLLPRGDVRGVVSALQDALGLGLERARVSRLDFAEDLELNRPVMEYLQCLGTLPRYNVARFGDGESVSYRNSLRCLEFYDKLREMTCKRDVVPPEFSGKYFLRYEVRFTKRLDHQFGRHVVVSDLWDREFYSKLSSRWRDLYLGIPKTKEVAGEVSLDSPRVMEKASAFRGLKYLGGEACLAGQIADEAKQKNLTRVQKQRLRSKLRQIADAAPGSKDFAVIRELDGKIFALATS
jgi:hypothetical protein